MYKAILINENTETIIHYPDNKKDTPKLNKLELKEKVSEVDSLSFDNYINNEGYNKIFELTTRIKVIDVRDNTTRFIGRILNADEKMDSSGLFYKEILCESAMSYLTDTKVRNAIVATSSIDFITQILNKHNAKVTVDKQIFV